MTGADAALEGARVRPLRPARRRPRAGRARCSPSSSRWPSPRWCCVGAGDPVWSTFALLLDYGQRPRSITLVLNSATTYYLSALAVAIGFRMNLFNIGVDGQYRLAAMTAAWVGGAVALPPGLHQLVIVLVAVLVGGLWAGLAGLLKATRGVSEVISTIMLNAIATGLVAFFLRKVAVPVAGSNNIGTAPIPGSGRLGGLPLVPGSPLEVFGFLPVAVLAGRRLLARPRPHPLRLRAARHRPQRVGRGRERRRRPPHGRHDHAAVGGGRRPGRHAAAARRLVLLQPRLPGRARLHRHRHRAAGPQLPRRHRLRRAAVGLPRRLVGHPRHRGHLPRDRDDHAGLDRAVGGHRLRAGAPLPAAGRAGAGRPARWRRPPRPTQVAA